MARGAVAVAVLITVFSGVGATAEDASAQLCKLLGTCWTPAPCSQATDANGGLVAKSPLAALPAPVPGQPLYPRTPNGRLPYGFAENAATKSRGHATPAQVGDIHRAVGGTLVRFDLNWGRVQAKDGGELCFNFYDNAYKALVARGVRPIFVLNAVPSWAAQYPERCGTATFCQSLPKREKYADFRAFARVVARRYPLAAAVEVWNEPNLETYVSSPPDPAHYAEVLTEVYEGVKQGNPAMRVLAFAVAPMVDADSEPRVYTDDAGGSKWVYGDGNFIRDTLAHGVHSKFDGVSFHPYPEHASSSIPPTDSTRFRATFARVREGLVAGGVPVAADGHPATRLVPDEMGYTATYGDFMEMRNQSTVLRRRFADLDAPHAESPVMADRVDAVLFFSGIDPSANSPYGWVTRYSSLLGFLPKPVFCDFRREVALLGSNCPSIR